jgi:hypothetical protein
MSKAKMKFPPVPGDTPRERFVNLVRQVITMEKLKIMDDSEKQKAIQMLKSKQFTYSDELDAWSNRKERKHFSDESIADISLDWLRARLDEEVPAGQFRFYSYYVLTPDIFERVISRYQLQDDGLTAIAVPFSARTR